MMNAQSSRRILLYRAAANLASAALIASAASGQDVLWLEAEAHRAASGRVELIDGSAADYGAMARTEASGGEFVRVMPGAKLVLGPVAIEQSGVRGVWVRAFSLAGRRVTVVVNGRVVGTTVGGSTMPALVWQRVGSVRLAASQNEVELRAAADNDNAAYVDCVALLSDESLMPIGRSPAEIIRMNKIARLDEEFAGQSMRSVAERWIIRPPPGADAVVEMTRKQDGGGLHIHNGSAGSFTLLSREPLDVKPGDQLTVRVRVRKDSLIEHITVSVPGVGSFAPQLYREFHTAEQTWVVPPSATGPILVELVGAGGGDTYISRVEAFRRDPPLSPFVTGRFLPPPDLRREGRLFEIERYVVNADAFTGADVDGDGRWSLCRLSREKNRPYFSRGTVLKSDSVLTDRAAPGEGCPPLRVRVGPLEPGRYQVYFSVPGRALAYSRDGKQWRRLPGTQLPDLGVVTMTEPFFEFWLDDRYVELSNPGPTYADFIRFLPIPEPATVLAPAPAPQPPERGSVGRRAVRLTIENPSDHSRREPVRSGVPIPKGELADASHARLLDAAGREMPLCAQATGRWPDGSVKWLLLDFEAEAAAKSSSKLTLEYGNEVSGREPQGTELTVEQKDAALTVRAGMARFVFDERRGGSFRVFRDGQEAPVLALADFELRAADGREWRLSRETHARVEVEEQNPLRAVVRLHGRFADARGPGPFAFDMRVHLFAGRPEALMEAGFIARADEDTIALKSARLLFERPMKGGSARLGLQTGASEPVAADRRPRLLQTGKEVYGGTGPFPFVLRDGAGQSLAAGERAAGWLRLDGGAGPALFAVPWFWQQFPKALACDERGVTIELWPAGDGVEPFIAHAGAGKSHRIGVSLAADASADRWLAPLFAQAEPAWYCASGAFEELAPRRAGRYETYEAIVDAAFEQLMKKIAGYGMENWGDVWQDGYVRGAKTWSNQEWDLVNNWVIPFVRTGERRFLDYAHEAARHFADVDCIHYSRDPKRMGGSWMHAHTSLRGHQLEEPNFPHAGWVEGLLNLYHLTGDRRGLETALGLGDYIVRRIRLTDQTPPDGPPYHLVIQRATGWPLTTLCLVYRDTWQQRYLQAARQIVDYERRCQDPERGIWDAQVGHEVPYRGGCVFAFTLFRGLRLFADITGDARARQDYARAARWVYGEMWRPGHRYLYEQCPLHEPGTRVPFVLSEMGGYATRLSGDPMHAAIAFAALREHSARGASSWMTGSAAHAQWGNGILQQVPRMLYDWEQTGLAIDDRISLTLMAGTGKVTRSGASEVKLRLANGADTALENLSASCLIRADWRARVARCPQQIPAHGTGEIALAVEPPPPIAQYELQNDLAYVHVLVRWQRGGQPTAAWGCARLEIAKP